MSKPSLPAAAADLLSSRADVLLKSRSLVGLDGFVDSILHVVSTRESAEQYTRMESMAEFGLKITAAAGLSANFEMVPQLLKLGGNG